MNLREFCQIVAFVLLATVVTEGATSDMGHSNARSRGTSPGAARNVSSQNSEQLCSAVMPKPKSPPPPVTLHTTVGAHTSSAGLDQTAAGPTDIIVSIDDGVRIMDSQKGGSGDNIFILGMTGAGKSTMTLLLTAYSSLYSCKRAASDLRYVIRDVKKKISTVDSLSKTKVPEIIHDPHLRATIYDCPGFSDTNSTDELTNAYFIKYGLDSSKRAKFLIVAPLHAFQTSGDRHYFGNLLLHVVKTITNVEKYKNSFALAVTFGTPTFSLDEIVKNVVGYLDGFLNEEFEVKFEREGEEVLSRLRYLLNSLLAQDENGTFLAIAVFRSPTSHGPLTDLVTTQEDRQLLMRVLKDGTLYADADPQDFDYSVSDSGKLRVIELETVIDETITQKLDQFWADIQRRYETELYQLTDPIGQKNSIESTLQTFLAVRQHLNARHAVQNGTAGVVGPKEFVLNLVTSLAPSGLDLPSNPILISVLLQQRHVKYLETLLRKPVQLQWTNWLKGLEPIEKFLQIYTNWASTLMKLEKSLGKYEIQNATYCLPEFRDHSLDSINVTTTKIENFISDQSAPTEIYDTLKAALTPFIGSRGVNLRQLNPILEHFFPTCEESSVKCTPHGTAAKFTGNFILASQLTASTSCISASTKQVIIFVWDTFFLDVDLNAKSITGNGTFSLVLIARKLKSFGHIVDLTGRNGHTPGGSTAFVSQNGTDGTEGEAGGYFLGVFGEKEGEMSVELNGGRGGDGQHGGTGISGRDGQNVSFADVSSVTLSTFWLVTHFHNYPDGCSIDDAPVGLAHKVIRGKYERCESRIPGIQDPYKVIFYGLQGLPGHTGGNGGKAGQGGSKGGGKVYEVNTNFTRSTTVESQCGAVGSSGKGGRGGAGGSYVRMTACFGTTTSGYKVGLAYRCTKLEDHRAEISYASYGRPGKNGSFPLSMCQPSQDFNPQSYTPQVLTFKSTARAQLQSPTARRQLFPFLMNLERSGEVNRDFYPAKYLIADLVSLEDQLPSCLKTPCPHLLFFYESILNRTAEAKVAGSPSEMKSVLLREVASVAFGRLIALQKDMTSGGRSNLITNLEGYIDLTNQALQSLTAMKPRSNATSQVVATKEKFLEFMQSRIRQVNDLVQQVIQPQIEKIQDELHKTMETMLAQLIEEKNKFGQVRNELYSQQLGFTLGLSKIFGLLKLVAEAVSFLGPLVGFPVAGRVARGSVSTVASIAQAFSSGDTGPSLDLLARNLQQKALSWQYQTQKKKLEDGQVQLIDLKAKLDGKLVVQAAEDIEEWSQSFEASKQRISSKLDRIEIYNASGVEERPQSFNLSSQITEVTQRLQQQETLKAEVRTELEQMEKYLKAQVDGTTDAETEAQELLELVQGLLGIVNTGAELYKLFKGDDPKVQELAKAEQILEGIDTQINTIDTRMPQILRQLRRVTTEAFESTRNQSELDVSSWQLQYTMDEISYEIESQILAGLPIDSQVRGGMEKLKEAFRTVFKVCDRIQDYMAEQCMASFVSDSLLSTVNATLRQQDPELHSNFQKLKQVSLSNFVLNYWRKIENSFRMYVFPYAEIYLSQVSMLGEDHDLILLPKKRTNLSAMVTEISSRTGELKTKLATFRTTIVPELHTDERAAGFTLDMPFYKWTSEEVKPLLADILSGRAVNLIADVRQSTASFDAIKFNNIHLHLVHEDAAVDSTLQSALTSFGFNMNHTGVNHYRFDEKHYRVYSEPLSFQASYVIGPSQHKNQNYVKLSQGPPLLSPYTLWTFQLYSNSTEGAFDNLSQFVSQDISLVLTGHGTYVADSDGQSATRQVDRFYKAFQL